MRSFKNLIVLILTLFTLVSVAKAEYFTDIIVTSPTGIWTDSRAYTTLNDAIIAIGASEQDLYIAKEEVVTTLVIPANIRLHFVKDGSIANSNTLTINTKNIHSDHQIFTGAGAVNFASGTEVHSRWFEDFETAITQTSNDTVTLLVNKSDTLLNSAAVGNNVVLKWDASNLITIDAGQTLSNIGVISAPNLRLFIVSGAIAFKASSPLDAIQATWLGDSQATLTIASNATAAAGKQLVIGQSYSITTDMTLSADAKVMLGATLSVDTTKTLTISGLFEGHSGCFVLTGTAAVIYSSATQPDASWWGLGTANDAVPIQAAVLAVHSGTKPQHVKVPTGSYATTGTVNLYHDVGLDCAPNVEFVHTGAVPLFGAAEDLWVTGQPDDYLIKGFPLINGITNTTDNSAFFYAKFDNKCGHKIIELMIQGNNDHAQNGIFFNHSDSNQNLIHISLKGLNEGIGVKLGDRTAGFTANFNYIYGDAAGSGFVNAVECYGQGNVIRINCGSSVNPIAFNEATGYAEGGLNVPIKLVSTLTNRIDGSYFDNGSTHVLAYTGGASGTLVTRLTAFDNVGLKYRNQIIDIDENATNVCTKTAADEVTILGSNQTTRYRTKRLTWLYCGDADPVNDGWWSGKVVSSTLVGADTVVKFDITVPDTVEAIFPSGINTGTPNGELSRVIMLSTAEQSFPNLAIDNALTVNNTLTVNTSLQIASGSTLTNLATGTFTAANNKDTVVNNTTVTASSLIFIMPTNAAAATLQSAATCLYISARTAGASFQVTTGNAAAAVGTETFNYWIVN